MRLVLALLAFLLPGAAFAACDPPNATKGMPGCMTVAPSVAGSDYIQMWLPGAFPDSWQIVPVDTLFQGRGGGNVDLTSPGPIGSTTPNTGAFTGLTIPNSLYYARNYPLGGPYCTWDATHDVGPCIQAAINAAAASGGGDVAVPSGRYGLATSLDQHTTGVHLVGLGVGQPRDTVAPSAWLPVTEFIWIGATGTTMASIAPAGGQAIYSVDVRGITFDCGSLADVCIRIRHATNSVFDIGVAEPVLNGAIFDTANIASGPGTQNNEIWVRSRSTSTVNSPTGILFDKGAGSSFNVSGNRIHLAYAVYNKGDGVVFGASDNNLITTVSAQPIGSATGTPFVSAGPSYVMKNGQQVNGTARANIFQKMQATGVITGYQSGSVITPGTNAGSAAINTISIATNAPTSPNNTTLNFASTTGVALGMTATCGGWGCGIPPHVPVFTLTGTTVVMGSPAGATVANPTTVVFSYGITAQAASGSYTMTAVDGTHWNLTAPAGGTSESNVSVVGGVVSFGDMVIPLTGTPTAGDTFVIVVPLPSHDITISALDKDNSIPDIFVEPGANAWLSNTGNPYFVPYGGTGDIIIISPTGSTATNKGVRIGGVPGGNLPGFTGVEIGGVGNVASGFGASAVGGHNNLATGTYATSRGDTNTSDGPKSDVDGYQGSARLRFNARCRGDGQFVALGDAEHCEQPLSGSGTSATIVRLTADKAAANLVNTANLPNNYSYRVSLGCKARQTGGASGTINDTASWTATALFKRGANAAATSFVAGYSVNGSLVNTAIVAGTAFAPTLNDAAASGWRLTVDADTTNGGVAVSGTGEASKNIQWLCKAETVE